MAAIDLTTVEKVREYLQKPATNVDQDEIIAALITRASRAIHTFLGLELRPAETATETFIYRGGGRLSLAPKVARTVTAVVWDADSDNAATLDASTYSLRPKPARDGVHRYLRLPGYGDQPYGPLHPGRRESAEVEVAVTGTWGYADVPEDVEHWCIVTVATWLRRDVQAFSTTLNLDTEVLERPESLPSAARAGLSHYRAVVGP